VTGTTLTLYPYLESGTWVFEDERTGLTEEAFVLGASEMITAIVQAKAIPDAERGFALTFSGQPFEGHDVRLVWQRPDPSGSGNWYAGEVAGRPMECWLCPALLLYFQTPPEEIFVRAEPLPVGVNPRWTPPEGVVGRRFVEAPK
ncbi:MAG: DUF6717 family protein, partial [Planctomycetia bacterium]